MWHEGVRWHHVESDILKDVICHSAIDGSIVLVCRETTGHQRIPVARVTGVELWWSRVRRIHRRWIPLTAWCFLSCLPKRSVLQTIELPLSWNPRTRLRCHCYVSFVNPIFPIVEHRDNYVTVIGYIESLTGHIRYKKSTNSTCAINGLHMTMAA